MMVWIIISFCVLFLFELGIFMYFEKNLKCNRMIEEWLKSNEYKEVIRKTKLILDNTRSMDKIPNSHFMISNIIQNERDGFEIIYPKIDKWIIEYLFNNLQKECDILFLDRKTQILERKLNKDR